MKPFLQGKKTMTVEPLRPAPQFSAAFGARGDASRGCAGATPGVNANVEVVKEGDKVVRLIVHCTCGERVEIECLYAAGS